MDRIPTPDDPVENVEMARRVITKKTDHPLRMILLGTVIGAFHLGDSLVLYYQDGHAAAFKVDDDGNIIVADHKVPTC